MEFQELYSYVESLKYEFCSDDKLIKTPYARDFILQIVDNGERGTNNDNIYINYLDSSDLELDIAKRVLQALLKKKIVTFKDNIYSMFTADDWGKDMDSYLCLVLSNE